MSRRPPRPTLFPYTTLFRSVRARRRGVFACRPDARADRRDPSRLARDRGRADRPGATTIRSEEHTSELQLRVELVCRLLLEKKKKIEKTCTHQRLEEDKCCS